MEEVKSNAGMWGWGGLNTLLGAAGTAMGATALGSKTSEEKVRQIIREQNCGCGNGYAYNGSSCGCGDPFVNRFELNQSQRLAYFEAKDYSDSSDLKLFENMVNRMALEKERVNNQLETIFKEQVASRERLQSEICRIDKEAALNKQASDYQYVILEGKIKSSEENTKNWVLLQNYVSGEVKLPLNRICPQPLPACVPVAFDPQTITTEATPNTGVIVANRAAASASK